MTLTPEDIVNKRFTSTRLREGYDQDEVDDYLDEIVVEFRRIVSENEELKQRLLASESRIAELQRSSGSAIAHQLNEHISQTGKLNGLPFPNQSLDTSSVEPSNSSNLLQLARRLHEEHVQEGVEKRDALIAEGHAAAAKIVAEAESEQKVRISQLQQEQAMLEHRIDELRIFERDYRVKLRNYIESHLQELDGGDSAPPAGTRAGSRRR